VLDGPLEEEFFDEWESFHSVQLTPNGQRYEVCDVIWAMEVVLAFNRVAVDTMIKDTWENIATD
jgi:hypothetical protein